MSRYKPREYWDERARKYHEEPLNAVCFLGAHEYNKYLDFLEKRVLLKALPKVRELNILDVGCGVGRLSFELENRGARVVGIDFSRQMVKLACEKGREINSVTLFAIASATHLPFPSDLFDVVLSVTVLEHITNDAAAIEAALEIVRVTKVDGLIMILDHLSGKKGSPSHQLAFRTRKEYIKFFETSGVKLYREYPVGIAPFWRWIFILGKGFIRLKGVRGRLPDQLIGVDDVLKNTSSSLTNAYRLFMPFVLLLSKPIDIYCMSKSCFSKLADYVLFLFKK